MTERDTIEAIKTLRDQALADLARIPDYAAAIHKSERSVWNYIKEGLPVTYIGRTPYVVLSKSVEYWSERATHYTGPAREGPRRKPAEKR